MAKNSPKQLDTFWASPQKMGRPLQLDDKELRSNRDQLLALLQATWCEVGWQLQNVRKPRDVIGAVSAWKNADLRLAKLLLLKAGSDEPRSAAEIVKMHQHRTQLLRSVREASDRVSELKTRLGQIDQALLSLDSDAEAEKLAETRGELAIVLGKSELDCITLNRNVRSYQKQLDEASAVFTRSEVAKFCNLKKYELRPERIANALAGLPFMSWGTSYRRCSPWKLGDLGGGQYNLVRFLSKAITSCPKDRPLTNWVKEQIEAEGVSPVALELKRNWHYLKASLTQGSGAAPDEMAFKIAREYLKRLKSRSPIDIVAEQADAF